MAFPSPRPLSIIARWFAPLLLLALAGCEDGRRSARGGGSAGMGPESRPPTPDMVATGTFFAGQVEVEILLGKNGFAHRAGDEKSDAGDSDTGSMRTSGGGFGGGGRRGRGGSGGGERSAERNNSDGNEPTPQIRASNEPPVRLHLRLTNLGTAPVEVAVVDFDSDLGNFVVQPGKMLLAPNTPTEAEPMISRLGLNADAIPVTVNLQVAGQREKQVLVLRVVTPSAPPPTPPTPASH